MLLCYRYFVTFPVVVCLFLISVDSSCLFPDVVDSRFPERVDSLPDIVDTVPGFVNIFLKVLTLAQAKP